MQGECEKLGFSTNISLYLGNNTTYYYGRRIGNRTKAFDLYQFQ